MTALVAVAPYAFGLDFPLLFDDRMAVLEHPDVQGPLDLHAIFTHNAWGNPRDYPNIANYRPLSVLTLAATRAISGSPLPFHAGNVGLHVAACLLLLALARRLGASAAAATLAACWFAAHPVHVEAVMLAVNREEILVTLFCGALLWLAAPRTSLVPDVGSEPWPRRLTLAVALLGGLALLRRKK